MLCAIHQPNFFPWLGYFEKISRADAFVFLNQVDYEKSGHSMQCYTNRVAIIDANRNKTYIHCPVIREHGPQKIDTIKIKTEIDWRAVIRNVLDNAYNEAPFKSEIEELMVGILDYETEYLSEFNINAITRLCEALGITTKLYRQDQFVSENHSTELLVELTKNVGCDEYLYGGGGSKYQEEGIFLNAAIKAVPQDFVQWKYNQGNGEFVSGLSILDSLYWTGIDETQKMIKDYHKL